MALFTTVSTSFVEYSTLGRLYKTDSLSVVNVSDNETLSLQFLDEVVLQIPRSVWIIEHATVELAITEINSTFSSLTGGLTTSELDEVTTLANSNGQGHYALLSSIYFGGTATISRIEVADTNTWLDVLLTVDALGTFDYRPIEMVEASAVGHSGDGSVGSPLVFSLEGLTQNGSCSLRVSMQFNPDDDEGRLDNRILFTRHSGTTPSDDFTIEATSVAMESGANIEYSNSPNVQFFIGDTIDTNGIGDSGTVKFQLRSDVAGTVTMNEIALFIQS
jgi:hypothetical protein